MAALSSSSSHLLHHVLRPPPTLPSSFLSSFFSRALPFRSQTTSLRLPSSSLFFTPFSTSPFSSSPSPPLSLSSSHPQPQPPLSLSNSNLETLPLIEDHEYEPVDDGESEIGDEDVDLFEDKEDEEEGEETVISEDTKTVLKSSVTEPLKLPTLTVKEKKELASYAHSLGKKLKSQQVGKSGVTDSVAIALVETLEANELLKLKIHNNCPGELDDIVKQLEDTTGSIVVGRIGRTVILYRPSLTKLKAEEKKKEFQRAYERKRRAFNPSLQNRGQAPRFSGRGRRGSSRNPAMSGAESP